MLYRPKFALNLILLNIHHQNTRLPIDSVYYLLFRINQIYINQYNILESHNLSTSLISYYCDMFRFNINKVYNIKRNYN